MEEMNNKEYRVLLDKFLRNEISPEEIKTLLNWIESKESFGQWMGEEWENADTFIDPVKQKEILSRIRQEVILPDSGKDTLTKEKINKKIFRPLRIVAIIILFILSGLTVYFYQEAITPLPDMTITVQKGQKANITLPDGTLVWLNSDSYLTYGSRFNKKTRKIELQGEAYFEVAPDSKRPFSVITPDMEVTALGTSFNVKSYKDENIIYTILMSGKVRVDIDGHDSWILLPHEMISVNRKSGKVQKTYIDDTHSYSCWRDNYLVFKEETLESIALILERNYNTRIIFDSEELKKYSFTGSPGNTSLESILQILSQTAPLKYEIKENHIILKENLMQKKIYEEAMK